MKILALAHLRPDVPLREDFEASALLEIQQLWAAYTLDTARELYLRDGNPPMAVLMLECGSIQQAKALVSALPMATLGFESWELFHLKPFVKPSEVG
jgi:hypothetical protein